MKGRTERTPERVAEVKRMRQNGMTWKQIGDHFGIALQTAHQWGTDPDGEKQKARKDSYRGECEVCGAPTGGDVGPGGRRYCGEHGPQIGAQRAQWWRDELHAVADPKYQEIVRMWNAGASIIELADHLGVSKGRISSLMARLREQGYDLPHRYAIEDGRRVSAKGRVA